MKKMSFWETISLVAVVVGSLNWGLVGLFHLNLIDDTFGRAAWTTRIIYILIGVAGLHLLVNIKKIIGKNEAEV